MVSDIVIKKSLPQSVLGSIEAYIGCISGAEKMEDYLGYMRDAGFSDIKILEKTVFSLDNINKSEVFREVIKSLDITEKDIEDAQESILSIKVSAIK